MSLKNTDHKIKPELQHLSHNGFTWIDVSNPTETVFSQLEADYHLHPVHLQESVQKVQLDQVEREAGYIFLLLHAPTYNVQRDKILTSQVGIFLGKDYIITVHDGHSGLASKLFDQCSQDETTRNLYFKRSPGYLLHGLVSQLLDDLLAISQTIMEGLDDLEDRVFDNEGSDAYHIGKLRQKIIRLKRIVGPLQTVLQNLTDQINDFSGEHLSKYFSNNTKAANHLLEIIKESKETIEIYKDADFTISTEKTNGILALLTLIFTLTIPATVFGAFYGMNVALPGGLSAGSWHFLGEYTTLIVVVLLSLFSAGGMYIYFKNKKWS